MAWRYDVEFCAKHRESRILRRLTAREKRRGGWLRVIKRKSLHAGEILFAFGKRKETCRRNGKNFDNRIRGILRYLGHLFLFQDPSLSDYFILKLLSNAA